MAISYVLHDLAALLMFAGFIIHVYEGTAHQPGTFGSMIDGTVTNRLAWTHHPAWFQKITGLDPAKHMNVKDVAKSKKNDELVNRKSTAIKADPQQTEGFILVPSLSDATLSGQSCHSEIPSIRP